MLIWRAESSRQTPISTFARSQHSDKGWQATRTSRLTHLDGRQVGEEVILDDIALHEIESITQLHSIQEFMSKSSILQKDLALRPAASGAHTSPERPADAPGVTPSIPTPPSDSSRYSCQHSAQAARRICEP